MSNDIESRLPLHDNSHNKIWLRLSACHSLIYKKLREHLRTEYDLTPSRFELMAHVASSHTGLKMGELSKRLMVTDGNITSIIYQLEKQAFIERLESLDDRRSNIIRLTSNGKKIYKKASSSVDFLLSEILSDLSDASTKKILKSLFDLKNVIQINSINK